MEQLRCVVLALGSQEGAVLCCSGLQSSEGSTGLEDPLLTWRNTWLLAEALWVVRRRV